MCKRIIEKLGQDIMARKERQVVCISQDSFYRELTPTEKQKALKGQFNFDHPSTITLFACLSSALVLKLKIDYNDFQVLLMRNLCMKH